jgi:hypothetical protein
MHKVSRAKVHLDALSQFIKDWDELHSKSFSTQDDVESGEYIIEIRPPDLDVRGALIAGDFVSCLRSSLDHLAWQLAAKAINGPPSKRICFPIFGENTIDSQIAFTKSTFGIPEEAVAIIRSLQPYQSGNSYKLHYLWILNALWNIDKHRHIPFHSMITDFSFADGTPKPIRHSTGPLNDHGKAFFRIADKPNVKFEPVKSVIIFGDKQEGVAVNIENFRAIYEAVSEKIIPAFSRFFE